MANGIRKIRRRRNKLSGRIIDHRQIHRHDRIQHNLSRPADTIFTNRDRITAELVMITLPRIQITPILEIIHRNFGALVRWHR